MPSKTNPTEKKKKKVGKAPEWKKVRTAGGWRRALEEPIKKKKSK